MELSSNSVCREFGEQSCRGCSMNNSRRKILKRALSMLESASQIISQAADQEQDSLDNLPESLQ